MSLRKTLLHALMLLLLSTAADAVEKGRAVVNGGIRAKPEIAAEVIAPLRQGELLIIQMRSTHWMKVKTDQQISGWVDMLDVKLQSSGWRKRASGFFRWFGSGQSNATASENITVGIRGISEEDLVNAQPNYAAITELDSYQVDQTAAAQHGRDQHLVARQVEPL